jgi:hypothetical protein
LGNDLKRLSREIDLLSRYVRVKISGVEEQSGWSERVSRAYAPGPPCEVSCFLPTTRPSAGFLVSVRAPGSAAFRGLEAQSIVASS